jgi:hypothetical protein
LRSANAVAVASARRGLDQVERLTDGDATGGRHRHPVHVEPAVRRAGGFGQQRPVPAQVAAGDLARVDLHARRGPRPAGRVDERLAEPALVQGIHPA